MREGEKLEFARQLRREMTDAENRMWFHLRSRRLLGYKFQRQKTIGKYIVDFCCAQQKLIVELDGGQHAKPDQEEKDQRRTVYLNQRGYAVIRFWDNDVLQHTKDVLQEIINNLSPHPA